MPDTSTPAPDIDLFLVRCFIVLAEHRHFGRAAVALHVTQSSLSRQMNRLERQVGARLIDRTPQGSRLTEAGEVFLPLARSVLRSAQEAAVRARAAAQPRRITIGHTANLIITPAVRHLRFHHPDADVHTVHLAWDEPRAALLDHRVDAAVVRLPFPTEDLRVRLLYDEPRVLLVPRGHRLAGKEVITLDDVADEPIPRGHDAIWDAFWRIDPRPDGRRAPDGPLIDAFEDKFEIVAGGLAVAIVPAGAGIEAVRPDLTTVPLEGVEPSHVVLATRAADRNRLVAAFCKYAEAHLTRAPVGST
jgi:DNA-binding transcriptional LysR family regulator